MATFAAPAGWGVSLQIAAIARIECSMTPEQDLLRRAYAAFNARDIESVLSLMHPDVDWANGMEGGTVHGPAAIRGYWTRQWSLIDPHVEPTAFHTEPSGRTIVTVHQVVRDRQGNLLSERTVQHLYRFENGLIRAMEIG